MLSTFSLHGTLFSHYNGLSTDGSCAWSRAEPRKTTGRHGKVSSPLLFLVMLTTERWQTKYSATETTEKLGPNQHRQMTDQIQGRSQEFHLGGGINFNQSFQFQNQNMLMSHM